MHGSIHVKTSYILENSEVSRLRYYCRLLSVGMEKWMDLLKWIVNLAITDVFLPESLSNHSGVFECTRFPNMSFPFILPHQVSTSLWELFKSMKWSNALSIILNYSWRVKHIHNLRLAMPYNCSYLQWGNKARAVSNGFISFLVGEFEE